MKKTNFTDTLRAMFPPVVKRWVRNIYLATGLRKIPSGISSSSGDTASLQKIGFLHGTDKGNEDHSFRGVSNLDVYARHFEPLRNKEISLLEIGVLSGASLRMWKEYFPHARIFGLDIDQHCKRLEEDRISIEIGSQTDTSLLECVAQKAGGFDIVIDDGSHVNKHILKSYEVLFKHLKPGGIYVIEDLACSYRELEKIVSDKGRGVRELWPGMEYNDPKEDLNNSRKDLDVFFERTISDLDHKRGEIASIEFWSGVCIIRKSGKLPA